MRTPIQLPDIPEAEQSPWVKQLLSIVEALAQRVQELEEENAQLRDEIAVLKGHKKRPTFKSSKMDEQAGKHAKNRRGKTKKRPGSSKRKKTADLKIDEQCVVAPSEAVPPGSRFKGYRDFVVQDLIVSAHNTRYRLQRWQTPDGRALSGQLPGALGAGHFGATLVSYVLYQHHHCQVTQPLLLEQLREWGIDISAGQINELLNADHERFHQEKQSLLLTGMKASRVVTVDDTGARHQGRNGYVTHIGNQHFAWFETTRSKSRINFLELLRAGALDYRVDHHARAYWGRQKLPKALIEQAGAQAPRTFADECAWQAYLDELLITRPRYRQCA